MTFYVKSDTSLTRGSATSDDKHYKFVCLYNLLSMAASEVRQSPRILVAAERGRAWTSTTGTSERLAGEAEVDVHVAPVLNSLKQSPLVGRQQEVRSFSVSYVPRLAWNASSGECP